MRSSAPCIEARTTTPCSCGVSPDHPYTVGYKGDRYGSEKSAADFGFQHGIEHVKALIDLGEPSSTDLFEVWSEGERPDGWTDSQLDGSDLRRKLLTAFRRIGDAVSKWGGEMQVSVPGLACVLRTPEDRIERALRELRIRGMTEPSREFPLTYGDVGSIESHGELTGAGYEELERLTPHSSLVTVAAMFCDVVNSTSMNERLGDAEWGTIIGAHQERASTIARRHGGDVRQRVGDGLFATFPTATTACLAGLDMAEDAHTHDIQVRVGIHLGDFREPAPGEDVGQQQILNLASRIEEAAAPGEVLASAAVRTLSAGDVEFELKDSIPLKGIPAPQELYRVLAGHKKAAEGPGFSAGDGRNPAGPPRRP